MKIYPNDMKMPLMDNVPQKEAFGQNLGLDVFDLNPSPLKATLLKKKEILVQKNIERTLGSQLNRRGFIQVIPLGFAQMVASACSRREIPKGSPTKGYGGILLVLTNSVQNLGQKPPSLSRTCDCIPSLTSISLSGRKRESLKHHPHRALVYPGLWAPTKVPPFYVL